MILIYDRNNPPTLRMKELADQVWERSDVDGCYTLVKMRHNTHAQWFPGVVKTEKEMLAHVALYNAQYPVTPSEAYAKTGVPVGGPRTLTRSSLRELLRDVYAQGAKDGDLLAGSFPVSDREVDDLIAKYLKKPV